MDIMGTAVVSVFGIIVLIAMLWTFAKIAHLTTLVNSRVTELITQTERAAELTGRLAGRLAERAEVRADEDRQQAQAEDRAMR